MGLLVDAHSDLLCDVYVQRLMGRKAVLEEKWIPRMRSGGIDLRVAVIY
ncbi:MAG: membrane dipeptidase, partial [Alphaproteobacteria bacterium]